MTALCGLTFQFFFTHECEALKMKEIMDFLKEEGISSELIYWNSGQAADSNHAGSTGKARPGCGNAFFTG